MLRSMLALLVCLLVGACGSEPPPLAKSAAEYLATIRTSLDVADVHVFVGPPIIRNGTWTDDDEPRIIRAAVADSLAAMGFAVVKMDNEADATARVRVVRPMGAQPATYDLEFLRGTAEVDSFRLEDAALDYGGAGRADRLRRAYTRMLAARAPAITRSPKLTVLAQKRPPAPVASTAPSAAPPKVEPPPVANDRGKALAWIETTNKSGASAAIVGTFTQQLDGLIASGQDGQWQLGWGVTKDGMARIARWRAGSFETRSITSVEATSMGIAEQATTFTTHPRGSLAPLGPSSAPLPPRPPPPPPPPLPPNTEVGKGRDAAYAWLNAHAKAVATATSILEQLDDVIKSGMRGEWKIGWSLTPSGKAYFFAWVDGAFQATEISVETAQAQGYKAYAVTFSKIER